MIVSNYCATETCCISPSTALSITFAIMAVASAVFLALSHHEIVLPQSATLYFSISLVVSVALLSFTSNCFGLCEDSLTTSSDHETESLATPQVVDGSRTPFLETAFPNYGMISSKVVFNFGKKPAEFTQSAQTGFFEKRTALSFDHLHFSPLRMEVHNELFPPENPFWINFDSPKDCIKALYECLFLHFNARFEKRGPVALTDGTSHYLLLGISKEASEYPAVTLWLADSQAKNPQENGLFQLRLDNEGKGVGPFHFQKEWTFRFPRINAN